MSKTPGPWTVGPLEGKYYGTEIIDAEGGDVCRVWDHDRGEPVLSEREERTHKFESDADRNEWMCDTHFETQQDYEIACLIAAAPGMSEALEKAPRPFTAIDDPDKLSAFIIEYADWFFKVRHPALTAGKSQ